MYFMMIYSDTVRYALMALAYLAYNKGRLVKAEEIAQNQNIPKPFLSKILHELARREILHSVKGPRGGFTLKVDPNKLTMWDVIVLMGEENKFNTCVLMPDKCDVYETNPCSLHHKWEKMKKRVIDSLKNTTIADLIEVEDRHLAELLS